MLLRAVSATLTFLLALSLTAAPSTATAGAGSRSTAPRAVAMPTLVGPADGVVEHDGATPVTVWYTGALYGWYTLVVTCSSAPGADPLRWVEHHKWRGSHRQERQQWSPEGGLPPGAGCAVVVRRDADRAETPPVTFDVVWGEGVLYLEPPSRPTVWPAPEDGAQQMTFVVHVRWPGDYGIRIDGRNGWIRSHDLGHVEPGRYAWSWDATRRSGAPVEEGRYVARADGRYDDEGWSEYVATPSRRFSVRYATETVTTDDRHGERSARHLDVTSFELANGPRRVAVRYAFHTLRRPALRSMSAGLDVNRLRRGYLLTATRNRRGRLRPALALAHLASDVGRPRRVRCRGLDLAVARWTVTFTLPRSCLHRGGRAMRAHYSVGDRHGHYDGGPDRGDYWTPWATYEDPAS